MRKMLFCIVMMLFFLNIKAQNSCGNTAKDCKTVENCCKKDTIKNEDISPSTLIIYYSKSNKRILRLAKKIGAKVLYAYKNFNAVAIKKPDNMSLDETKAKFEELSDVLQVNYDHVYHLD